MSIASAWNPMGTAAGGGGLPPEYEARQYLASWQDSVNARNHHSLDTGSRPTAKTRWEVKLNVVRGAWGGQMYMGCYTKFELMYSNYGYVGASQGTNDDHSVVWPDAKFGKDLVCIIDNAAGYAEIGNGGTGEGDFGRRHCELDPIPLPTDTIHLFSRGDELVGHTTKIYWSRIYEDGVLVQDLVPCVRKSDGRRGMYDLVGRNFLVNLVDGYDFDTDMETHGL